VLAVGLVASLPSLAVYLGLGGASPHPLYRMNFLVYRAAARAALDGGGIYAAAPAAFPGYGFLYPPVVALTFLPLLAVPPGAGYGPFVAASVAAGGAAGLLAARHLRAIGVPVGGTDAGLLAAYGGLSTHAVPSLYFGNVNLFLAAGVAAGLYALEHRRPAAAGVALGLVALVKAFPALLGLWLARAREPRAVAAWVAVGGGGLLAGLAAFGPGETAAYARAALDRVGGDAFVGGLDPAGPFYVTVQRPLSHLLYAVAPGADPAWLTPLAVALLAPVVAACYRDLSTPTDRLIAAYATAAAAVLVVPSARLYLALLVFPLGALVYALSGPGRRALLAGGALISVTVRPGDLLTGLAAAAGPTALPDPLAAALAAVSLPTVGLALTLAGCLRAKRS